MSIDETLETLALELAAEWDPTLDVSAGSAFRSRFLTPLLERIGGSPLEVDLETFLAERIKEEIPESDVDEAYSAMRDLVVRAFIPMAEPLRREIRGVKTSQSLNNYATMTRDEVDSLLGNYFTSLRTGTKAGGVVRMYTPEKTQSYEALVKLVASQAMDGRAMFDGPVRVKLGVMCAIPKSLHKRGRAAAHRLRRLRQR